MWTTLLPVWLKKDLFILIWWDYSALSGTVFCCVLWCHSFTGSIFAWFINNSLWKHRTIHRYVKDVEYACYVNTGCMDDSAYVCLCVGMVCIVLLHCINITCESVCVSYFDCRKNIWGLMSVTCDYVKWACVLVWAWLLGFLFVDDRGIG